LVTRHKALVELLSYLKAAQYQFVAVTPATHVKMLARPASGQLSLRDVFGWNHAFDANDVGSYVIELLQAATALDTEGGKLRSRVRVASLGQELLLHGSFPTDEGNSVFLGPDTYRFVRFVEQHLPRFRNAQRLADMGAGSGAGAIAAAKLRNFEKITMIDTNVKAIELAAINAEAAGVPAELLLSDQMPRGADLIIANPPYMADEAGRSYRDGGKLLGGAVALDWAKEAIAGLAPGGAMFLYTGAAYVDGEAPLVEELRKACAVTSTTLELAEIDPDVFGEELGKGEYETVERIAAIGALISA
jgi:methylase of polypeptide subunit release factors